MRMRTFAISPVIFCTALRAASTGPTPWSVAENSLPSMLSLTNAYGMVPIPVDTENPSSLTMRRIASSCMTSLAMDSSSTSVTCLPMSPAPLTLASMARACSSVGRMPYSASIAFIPCSPACLPTCSQRLRPTSSGLIGSYVSGLDSTPCVCMPDSWPNALSPTMALFGCTCMPTSLETSFEAPYIRSECTPVSYFSPNWRHCRAMTSSSSDALPALSPMPLTVTWAHCAPACTPETALATASPKSLWQCTLTGSPPVAPTASRTISAM